jgi:hypothetical protein
LQSGVADVNGRCRGGATYHIEKLTGIFLVIKCPDESIRYHARQFDFSLCRCHWMLRALISPDRAIKFDPLAAGSHHLLDRVIAFGIIRLIGAYQKLHENIPPII